MRVLKFDEFQAELKKQGVPRKHLAFRCPICGTVQSMASLIAAGAGNSEEDAEKYIGFSCVGRFTGAGPFHRGDQPGNGCDWSLGGLFHLHTLEIETADGQRHMHFEPATPEQAQSLMKEYTECVETAMV
jgi:hypothetical protein